MKRVFFRQIMLVVLGIIIGGAIGSYCAFTARGQLGGAILVFLFEIPCIFAIFILLISALIFRRKPNIRRRAWSLGLLFLGMIFASHYSSRSIGTRLHQQDVIEAKHFCETVAGLVITDYKQTEKYPKDLSQYNLSDMHLPYLMQEDRGPIYYVSLELDEAACGFFDERSTKAVIWYDIDQRSWR